MSKGAVDISMYGAQNAAKVAAVLGQAVPASPCFSEPKHATVKGQENGQETKSARPRHVPGRMNKTEAAYALLLDARVNVGEVRWYAFEGMKFRLADRCWYTPDFFVVLADGSLEVHETKGHMEDDAAVKLRVFRKEYEHIGLVIARLQRGVWTYERR